MYNIYLYNKYIYYTVAKINIYAQMMAHLHGGATRGKTGLHNTIEIMHNNIALWSSIVYGVCTGYSYIFLSICLCHDYMY